MSTILFTEQENGNLKLIAEVDIDNPALAVDALLDETPRLKDREFMALVGTADEGMFTRVVVEDDEPVNPRRSIRVTGSLNGADTTPVAKPTRARRTRKAAPAKEAVEEPKIDGRTKEGRAARAAAAAAQKPKPRGRKPAAAKAAAKPKPRGRKPAAKKGASPFKRNAASDE